MYTDEERRKAKESSRMWIDGENWGKGLLRTPEQTREEVFDEGRAVLTIPINGTFLERVKHGDLRNVERACVDCGAMKGEVHIPGCDYERCPSCKNQLISCDCEIGPHPVFDKLKHTRNLTFRTLHGVPRPAPKHSWPKPS